MEFVVGLMFEKGSITLLISLGSILGAILRMEVVQKIENIFNNRFLGIYLINIFATFLLGYLVAWERLNGDFLQSHHFALFFKIGFLGSFSTFSSFVLAVFRKIKNHKFLDAFSVSLIYIASALITGFLGYQMVYIGSFY